MTTSVWELFFEAFVRTCSHFLNPDFCDQQFLQGGLNGLISKVGVERLEDVAFTQTDDRSVVPKGVASRLQGPLLPIHLLPKSGKNLLRQRRNKKRKYKSQSQNCPKHNNICERSPQPLLWCPRFLLKGRSSSRSCCELQVSTSSPTTMLPNQTAAAENRRALSTVASQSREIDRAGIDGFQCGCK